MAENKEITFHFISKNRASALEESLRKTTGVFFNNYKSVDGEDCAIYINGKIWECKYVSTDVDVPALPNNQVWYERTNKQTFAPSNENNIVTWTTSPPYYAKATRKTNSYTAYGIWSYLEDVDEILDANETTRTYQLGTLESIYLPVKRIGSYAFHLCPALKRVMFSNCVEFDAPYVFSDCQMLRDIVVCTLDFPDFAWDSTLAAGALTMAGTMIPTSRTLWVSPTAFKQFEEFHREEFAIRYPDISVKSYTLDPSIVEWPKYVI